MKAPSPTSLRHLFGFKTFAEMPMQIRPPLPPLKKVSRAMSALPLPPIPPFGPHVPKVPKNRDYPEVLLLYGWLCFAASIGVYSVKKVMLSNEAGSYLNVNLRGDIERQAEKGRLDAERNKHSIWWRLAQIKVDKDGANIGVLWDNRTRPHQYSKPGEAGIGAGIPV